MTRPMGPNVYTTKPNMLYIDSLFCNDDRQPGMVCGNAQTDNVLEIYAPSMWSPMSTKAMCVGKSMSSVFARPHA